MARHMTDEERRSFLLAGTRTGVLATVRKDGRPHAAPIWFTLDGDDVVFNTGAGMVKGRNLRRTGRAVLIVEESTPPFDFVSVDGRVESYGRRNAVPGELLVRLRPDKILALAGIAD